MDFAVYGRLVDNLSQNFGTLLVTDGDQPADRASRAFGKANSAPMPARRCRPR